MGDDQDQVIRRDEPGPDEGIRIKDTEGHKQLVREGGPDEGLRLPAKPEGGDEPGPDDAHFSDRRLKIGILPVEW